MENEPHVLADEPHSDDLTEQTRSYHKIIGIALGAAIVMLIIALLFWTVTKDHDPKDRTTYAPISQADQKLRVVGIHLKDVGKELELDLTALKSEELEELRGKRVNVKCNGASETSRADEIIPADDPRLTFDLDPKLSADQDDSSIECNFSVEKVSGKDSKKVIAAIESVTL